MGQISRSFLNGQEYLEVTDTGKAAAGYTTLAHGGDEVLLYGELSGRDEILRCRLGATDPSIPGNFRGAIQQMKQGTIARGLRTAISTQSAVMLYDPRNGNYTVGRFGVCGDFNIKSSGMTTPGFERVAVGTDRYLLFLEIFVHGYVRINGCLVPPKRLPVQPAVRSGCCQRGPCEVDQDQLEGRRQLHDPYLAP